MNAKKFAKYYQKYYEEDRMIQRLARKLAKNDRALYEDLLQIGLITLWKLDPSKAVTNEGSWIRQAMKFRMIDYVRKERSQTSVLDSLDTRLAAGDQLEKDPETGLFRLLAGDLFKAPVNLIQEQDVDALDQEEFIRDQPNEEEVC